MATDNLVIELYNLLSKDRTNVSGLCDFLEKYGDYETLKNIFKKLEIIYSDNALTSKLLIGQIGPEINKQKSIFEFPTLELINLIDSICETINITKIEEIMTGQGLLSCMLNKILNKNQKRFDIVATDGFCCLETSGKPTYYNIQKKLLLQYTLNLNNPDIQNTLYIVSWPPNNVLKPNENICGTIELINFIANTKPKYLVIIGDLDNYNETIKLNDILNEHNYMSTLLPIKQICHKDYFKIVDEFSDTINYPQNASHSSVLFCSMIENMNEIDIQLLEILNQGILEVCKNNLREILKMNDDIVMMDLYSHEYIPAWPLKIDQNEKKVFISKLGMLYQNKHYDIPDYIKNFNDFIFWSDLQLRDLYPEIKKEEKFVEYKELVAEINNGNLSSLKQKYIIPIWIDNNDEGLKYLYVEYSTPYGDKLWKYSSIEFREKYTRLASRNHLLY